MAADLGGGSVSLVELAARLALDLQGAGYAPIDFGACPEAPLSIVGAGASLAGSVDQVGHSAKVALVCVTDGVQLPNVLGDSGGGLLQSAPAGGPVSAGELSDLLAGPFGLGAAGLAHWALVALCSVALSPAGWSMRSWKAEGLNNQLMPFRPTV